MAKFTDEIDLRSALLRAKCQGVSETKMRELAAQVFGEEEPERPPRDYTEWKARKAAKAGGQVVALREPGRQKNLIELARAMGRPIRGFSDYKRFKREMGGDSNDAA